MRNLLFALALVALFPVAVRAAAEDKASKGNAYCYFDARSLTWRIGNDAVERTLHFARDPGALRTERITAKKLRAVSLLSVAGSEGEFLFTPGDSAASVRLDSDWLFMWQTVANTAQGGRLLTIHLQGQGRHRGYSAEVTYEVYPGHRPYLVKTLSLLNLGDSPRTVREIVYERLALEKRAGQAASAAFSGQANVGVLAAGQNQPGVVAGLEHPQGSAAFENGAVVLRVRADMEMKPQFGRASGPKAVVAVFLGTAATGKALYQRFPNESHAAK